MTREDPSSANDHDAASEASRALCDQFGKRLRELQATRFATKTPTWCAYSEPLDARSRKFAYVKHTKKQGTITVWLLRDAKDPIDSGSSQLPFKSRALDYKGPYKQYGHSVQIGNPSQLDDLIEIMVSHDIISGAVRDSGESSSPRIYPDEIEPDKSLIEGASKQVTVNQFERNPAARKACLSHHGTSCAVCDMDFKEVYGPVAAGVIHVHHLRPLSVGRGAAAVDPTHDLIPVCPNCHTVIHLRTPCYTIDEVRKMLRRR